MLVDDRPVVLAEVHRPHVDPQLAHVVDVRDALGLGVREIDLLDPNVLLEDVEEGLPGVPRVLHELSR